MRGKLAARTRSGKPKKLPAINVETLIADLRSLRSLNEKDPAAARESLLRVVERRPEARGRQVRGDADLQKHHGRHRWRPCRR